MKQEVRSPMVQFRQARCNFFLSYFNSNSLLWWGSKDQSTRQYLFREKYHHPCSRIHQESRRFRINLMKGRKWVDYLNSILIPPTSNKYSKFLIESGNLAPKYHPRIASKTTWIKTTNPLVYAFDKINSALISLSWSISWSRIQPFYLSTSLSFSSVPWKGLSLE